MFITFEGTDGSGKTTQIELLAGWLERLGYEFVTVKQPGSTTIGSKLRDIILNNSPRKKTEALLFAAAICQCYEEIIIPALIENKIVISDRYTASTIAYQCYGNYLNKSLMNNIVNFAAPIKPDVIFFMDIDPAAALNRRLANKEEVNRIDNYDLSFHQDVYDGYLRMADERWQFINADRDKFSVQEDIRKIVDRMLNPDR